MLGARGVKVPLALRLSCYSFVIRSCCRSLCVATISFCGCRWACCVRKRQRPTCPLCKQSFSSIRRYERRNTVALQEEQQQQLENWPPQGAPATGALVAEMSAESGARRRNRLSSCSNSNCGKQKSSSGSSARSLNSYNGGENREQNVKFQFIEVVEACVEAILSHRRLRNGAVVRGGEGEEHSLADAEGEMPTGLMLLSSQTTTPSEAGAGAGGCQICGEDTDWTSMLLCDGCDEGFHLYCLSPPLRCVPAGRWFCPRCCEEPPPTAADARRAAVARAATAVATRTARRRERELRRGHRMRRSTAQSDPRNQRRHNEQQQRHRRNQQRRPPRQRQRRNLHRSTTEGVRQRRHSPTRNTSERYEHRARRSGERPPTSDADTSHNGSSGSSSGSRAWRSLEKHGWLQQFLYRRPTESRRGTLAGAAEPVVAREAAPAALPFVPGSATAAAATSSAEREITAPPAFTVNPAAEYGGVCSLHCITAPGTSSQSVVESLDDRRHQKRRRVSSSDEKEDTTGVQGTPAGGRRDNQQQQQEDRVRLFFSARRRHRRIGTSDAGRSRDDSSTDRGSSRSAMLVGIETGNLIFPSSTRRGVSAAHPQLSQHSVSEGEMEGDRDEHRAGTVSEEQDGGASDEYDLDGFVVSDSDPLVPASETSRSSGSQDEEELQSPSSSNASDYGNPSSNDCEGRRSSHRQRCVNLYGRRPSQRCRNVSSIDIRRSSSTSGRARAGRVRIQRQVPVGQQRRRETVDGSGNRVATYSSSTRNGSRREPSSHASSNNTAAAVSLHAPLRNGLPRQEGARSVAARALAYLQPNYDSQQRSLLGVLHMQQQQQ